MNTNKYNLNDAQIKILINTAFLDGIFSLPFNRDEFREVIKDNCMSHMLKYGDIIREFGSWTAFKNVYMYFDEDFNTSER